MFLTKETILGANDLKREVVTVPEWGGDVIVRAMTGAERERIEKRFYGAGEDISKADMDNLRPHVLVMTLIDENGNPLFHGPEDVKALNRKNALVLGRLFEIAQKLSGMSSDAVEDEVGNSGKTQDEGSASD